MDTTFNEEKPELPICGIIMPIASSEDYSANHWTHVRDIISEAASDANFSAKLVSSEEDISVIHSRIVQNVYSNPIVVCDISSKNPNVMFELGMRLAFDKPTIIIKDDKTAFSFDISPIEHLIYPKDLNYYKIKDFKNLLKNKILSTYKKASQDENYSTFLKNFEIVNVKKLKEKDVSENEFIFSQMKHLTSMVRSLLKMRSPLDNIGLENSKNNITWQFGIPDDFTESHLFGLSNILVEHGIYDYKHDIIKGILHIEIPCSLKEIKAITIETEIENYLKSI